jgi:hypothetical protein
MKVTAETLRDPAVMVAALIKFSRTRMWFLFWRPTDAEWATDWYRDPGSAWWDR